MKTPFNNNQQPQTAKVFYSTTKAIVNASTLGPFDLRINEYLLALLTGRNCNEFYTNSIESEDLRNHYISGFVDGDGGIHITVQNDPIHKAVKLKIQDLDEKDRPRSVEEVMSLLCELEERNLLLDNNKQGLKVDKKKRHIQVRFGLHLHKIDEPLEQQIFAWLGCPLDKVRISEKVRMGEVVSVSCHVDNFDFIKTKIVPFFLRYPFHTVKIHALDKLKYYLNAGIGVWKDKDTLRWLALILNNQHPLPIIPRAESALPSKFEFSYVLGFFEAEGSIGFDKKRKSLTLDITQSVVSMGMMERLADYLQNLEINPHTPPIVLKELKSKKSVFTRLNTSKLHGTKIHIYFADVNYIHYVWFYNMDKLGVWPIGNKGYNLILARIVSTLYIRGTADDPVAKALIHKIIYEVINHKLTPAEILHQIPLSEFEEALAITPSFNKNTSHATNARKGGVFLYTLDMEFIGYIKSARKVTEYLQSIGFTSGHKNTSIGLAIKNSTVLLDRYRLFRTPQHMWLGDNDITPE